MTATKLFSLLNSIPLKLAVVDFSENLEKKSLLCLLKHFVLGTSCMFVFAWVFSSGSHGVLGLV